MMPRRRSHQTLFLSYAGSYARVSGGLLHHSLTSNAPEVEVKTVIKYRDREVIKKEPYPVKVENIVEVEKKLSKWQSARMRAGEIAMGSVGIFLLFWIIKKIVCLFHSLLFFLLFKASSNSSMSDSDRFLSLNVFSFMGTLIFTFTHPFINASEIALIIEGVF